jgi:hypothetical protein
MKAVPGLACLVVVFTCATGSAQPVLRYTFDEASGNALDSGQAPLTDAAFVGGATRSSDTPSGTGSSLDMRSEAPYAHLLGTDAEDLDGLSALTLTTWLKVETYVSGNNRLVAKQAGAPNFDGFSLNMNATRIDPENDGPASPSSFRLGMFLGGSDGFGSVLSDAYADASQWAFIATTYDSVEGMVSYYTGGVNTPVTQLGSTLPLSLNPGVVDGLAARFAVGLTDAAPTANTSVLGWQDDVRVYNTALDLAALDAVRLENLQAGPQFDGDFNEDDKVDGGDLAVWQMGFGASGTATHMQGDADADMDVDGADFLVWQRELGSPPPVAAIPEPGTSLLLVLSVAPWISVLRNPRF